MTHRPNLSIIGNSSQNVRFNIFKVLTEQLGHYLQYSYNIAIYGYKKEGISNESQSMIRRFYLPVNPNPVQQLSYRFSTLKGMLTFSEVSLFLGTPKSLLFPLFRLFPEKKVIVFLEKSHWQQKGLSKLGRLKAQLTEKIAVQFADQIIAEHNYLAYYIKETYNKEAIVIPYGGDHLLSGSNSDRGFSFPDKRYVLGITSNNSPVYAESILKAFVEISEFHLVLLGNWQDNPAMQAIHSRYDNYEHIHLLDINNVKTSFDAMKRGASIYLHHHAEDTTHPLLLESMSLGIPVVAMDTPMNRELTSGEATYYTNEEMLTKLLIETSYAHWSHNGEQMRRVINRNHLWQDITAKFNQVFMHHLYPEKVEEEQQLLLESGE